MTLTEILSMCAVLVSIAGNILTWTLFINKKFDKARDIQDAADTAMKNEFMSHLTNLKTEVRSDIDKAHTGIQTIREHFAPKTEVSNTENRLTTLIAEIKTDMRDSIRRIEDKLETVPRLTAQVENLIEMMRSDNDSRR